MKQKIKDALTVLMIIVVAGLYFLIGYEILTILNIGADGS